MLSRVANNLYWLGRYMERGYGTLLSLKVAYLAAQDSSLDPFNGIFIGNLSTRPEKKKEASIDYSDVLNFNLFEKKNEASIFNNIYNARENARSVQDSISRELWLCVNKYYLHLKRTAASGELEDPIDVLDELIQLNSLYYGITDLTQERGSTFFLMNSGKNIERVFQTIEFLNKNLINPVKPLNTLQESLYWKNLLLCIGGYQLYMRTYKSTFEADHVLELLLTNAYFPHSVFYSVTKLKNCIIRLNDFNKLTENKVSYLVGKLESRLKYTSLENIRSIGLESFLSGLRADLNDITVAINEQYFSY